MLSNSRSARLFGALALLALSALALPSHAAGEPASNLTAAPAFVERLATPKLLDEVRHGGFVLYLRHGLTDNSRPDRMPAVDLNDCSTQRPLVEEGRRMAAQVGEAMRREKIPFADMHISPLCRVKETVAAAFPDHKPRVDELLMYTANLTAAQKKPIIENTRRLFTLPVPPGTNRLVVAHGPNLMDLIGYFPREGTLVIFRPLEDQQFEYVASIPPEHWAKLRR